jgi:hypothetical protein
MPVPLTILELKQEARFRNVRISSLETGCIRGGKQIHNELNNVLQH